MIVILIVIFLVIVLFGLYFRAILKKVRSVVLGAGRIGRL